MYIRKNKKRKYSLLLLLLVLGVTVGYAFLSTTLNINGTTKVKNATWNIYWDNPQVTSGSVTDTKPTIDTLKTTATFDITLNNPGDYYEFMIDAKNAGTIDGMISTISYKLNDTEISLENPLPAYLNYTVTYSDDVAINTNHLLAANTKETYKVRVEFKKDIENTDLPGEEVDLDLKFAVTYVQADSNATEAHPSAITYISRQNEGQITPGDVIGIGDTEDFYVISSNAEKTVLLAKYNLLVGNESHDSGSTLTPMNPATTAGYGLQNVNAVSYTDSIEWKGMVAFSTTNYWMNSDTLKSQYSENDTIYYKSSKFKNRVDETEVYPYVYDENSTIYPYINGENGYVSKLKKMGAPKTITGRLLTYEEAGVAHYIEDNGSLIMSNGHTCWLGSVYSDESVWSSYGNYNGSRYDLDFYAGVRPVIEIPTSELQ